MSSKRSKKNLPQPEEEGLAKGLFKIDSSDESDFEIEDPNQEDSFADKIGEALKRWSPAIKLAILGLICIIAVASRVFSIIRYESVIHEFDPWFNFRATKVLVDQGYQEFKYWIDQEVWYPLGRYSGYTLYPGLMMTAWGMFNLLQKIFLMPVNIREVCVFTAPVFSAFTSIVTYLLTKEVCRKSGAGMIAALFMAVIPTYMSRSVAGSYDNEAVAIFALVFSFYTFVRSLNTGSMLHAIYAGFALYYMVLGWGGYVFVLGFMSVYVIALIFLNRFDIKAYITFSIVYIICNMTSLTIRFVDIYAVWQSSEHLPSHIAFILIQLYYIRLFFKGKVSESNFKFLTRLLIQAMGFLIISGFIFIVVMGKTTVGHRILTLVNPVFAKKHNPLVASISEHQSTAWSSMFFDLHFLVFFAPIGAYWCLKKVQNAKLFVVLYGLIGFYFSSVMIRLMLVSGPALCILSGIGLSYLLKKLSFSIKAGILGLIGSAKPKESKNVLPMKISLLGLGLIYYLVLKSVFHGTWAAAEAYSHPSIILAYNRGSQRVIIDDYREAYSWLRHNTKPSARVMSWWDYGYQIAGMANRTTLVDNNTWNKTHIGKVGMIMGSREEEAFELAHTMDVDYVLVVFGGTSGYSGDDINKFLWMVRIGGSENPHIKEQDYFAGGHYRVDAGGSRTMLNCLMYKLSYYRFSEVRHGREPGFDAVRQTVIGNQDFKLNYFEEAYTTQNWIIRIYRVKKRSNTNSINYSGEELEEKNLSLQALSGLGESRISNPFTTEGKYSQKNHI